MAFMTSYKCPECGNTNYETGQIRVSGGFWSSFFDVGNRRYNTVTCTECGYTKFYRKSVSGIQKIFDFMGSWSVFSSIVESSAWRFTPFACGIWCVPGLFQTIRKSISMSLCFNILKGWFLTWFTGRLFCLLSCSCFKSIQLCLVG